ncbi:hypothetical protein DLJ59_18145 [Micromonospora inaquosa]|uniref:Uncharacterized protein n=1 Tax=Micromonospora inaquosa TaxID=2203716 RepID=A0A3N9X2P1_9ACTN|nr:hypothetical protein DLJ59_18145 [Micromonospora inaquosa]
MSRCALSFGESTDDRARRQSRWTTSAGASGTDTGLLASALADDATTAEMAEATRDVRFAPAA